MEGNLACSFGGRVAEEIVFGAEKITTGAAGDIEQATSLARRMVTQWGMSDKVGMIAVGDREQEIFLGRELSQRREVSDQMAQIVDSEIKRFIDEAYERARIILNGNRELLDRLADALLDRETLDRDEIELLVRGETLPPRPVPPPPPTTPTATASAKVAKPAPAPGMLGSPPAEPAGA